MSEPVVANRVRRGYYLDSVALMLISAELGEADDVLMASLMIGTESNIALLVDAGLLGAGAPDAGPNDLIVAVRAATAEAAAEALDTAESLLDRPRASSGGESEWNPKSLDSAIEMLTGANLAIVSVPGAFAAREARRALARGLHVMLFSDNVAVADECALKADAAARGLLMMGPDCGTAIIGGVPLGFANNVLRGSIGLVAASGTGLQEVSTLIARNGGGISHAIGVGGRDLYQAVGGATTLAAIDALDSDPGTERIVLISKPPAAEVARRVLDRAALSAKPFTICFFGMSAPDLPANATFAPTLRAAAEHALGGIRIGAGFDVAATANAVPASAGRENVLGLFAGGTLCAEAQAVFQAAGVAVASNAPVPGADSIEDGEGSGHVLLDLGADEYTLGRPHPMIDPAVRRAPIENALARPDVAVLLLDVVLGHGAHGDPAGDVAAVLATGLADRPAVVASVCGTEEDPQIYSEQAAALEAAGVMVAPSSAHAAELALAILGRR